MDVLFLLLLVIMFIFQIIMLILSARKKKRKMFLYTLLLEVVCIFVAILINYYFNEIAYKYAPGFEGFFEILASVLSAFLYFIMFIITSIALVVKTAKNK